jgi:hypothetical protein
MGMFDSILSTVSEHADVQNLAAKIGIDPEMAEKAIAALGIAHQEPGDTAELAAQKTGLDIDTIQSLIGHIGGEGSLGEFASQIAANPSGITSLFDKNGDGSALDVLIAVEK